MWQRSHQTMKGPIARDLKPIQDAFECCRWQDASDTLLPLFVMNADRSQRVRIRQLWGFRLAASLLIPILLIGGCELVLRLAGVGYSTAFFLPTEHQGQSYWRENPRALWRFMPPSLARQPRPLMIPRQKEAGVTRIFVLGESAALGDPEPAFGVSRILQILLEHQYPEKKFEIFNTSITAINSHLIKPMAKELASMEGDYWLVFMGNNEVMGPYGPGSVAGESISSPWLMQTGLALKQLRLGQWIGSLGAASSEAPAAWRGMEMFAQQSIDPKDPRLKLVHQRFGENLQAIVKTGLDSGARIALSTVPVNLLDQAPFSSCRTEDDSSERLLKPLRELIDARLYAEALDGLQRLESTLSQQAQWHWMMGFCLQRLEQFDDARSHLAQARDLDCLPFRADSSINQAIRQCFEAFKSRPMVLIDFEATLMAKAKGNIPGDDLFWDHVHMKFPGNYLMALMMADWLARDMQSRVEGSAQEAPQWLSMRDASRFLGMTLWSDHAMHSQMKDRLSQFPFAGTINYHERISVLEQALSETSVGLNPESFEGQAAVYLGLIRSHRQDWHYQEQFARFLEVFGKREQAITTWHEVLKIVPQYLAGRFQLAQLLGQSADSAVEAESLAQGLVDERPEIAVFHLALGRALYAQSRDVEAIEVFKKTVSMNPDELAAWIMMGASYRQIQKPEEAIACFERVLQKQPDQLEAHRQLLELHAEAGNQEEASKHRALIEAIDQAQAVEQIEEIELF